MAFLSRVGRLAPRSSRAPVASTMLLHRAGGAAAAAMPKRFKTNWVRAFLNRDAGEDERKPAVPDAERGIPAPDLPAGTELRNPSSIRAPYSDVKRIAIPGEEDIEAKQQFEQMFMGIGVVKSEVLPYCRIDEFGHPIPKHQNHAFPKSRKLVQDYDIVIVGGGTAGITVAQKLNGAGMTKTDLELNDEGNLHLPANEKRFNYKTLIIEPSGEHFYQPLWTLVGGGKRTLDDSVGDNWKYVYGMENTHMLPTSVVEFLPHENALITADGRKVTYKQLVVASGLEVKINKIKGLSDALGRAGVSSNYVYPYPARTWDFIKYFPGGNAIFTMPAGPIKCPGAPQKIMYMAEDYWRRHVGRDLVNIKYVTGHPKLFGVPKYENTLKAHCAEVGITDLNYGLNLVEVAYKSKEAIFERVIASAAGSVGDRVTLPYDFLHVVPPQGPYQYIADSELADANGWVEVNKSTLQHVAFPNIFALGDCSSTPNSKTAAAVGAQAGVLVENLIRYRESRPLKAVYDGYAACPFTLGYGKSIIAEFDYSGEPRETFPVDGAKPSRLLYHIKEEYLPAVYWNNLLEGTHDMDEYRRTFAPLRRIFGPAEPQAQAQAKA